MTQHHENSSPIIETVARTICHAYGGDYDAMSEGSRDLDREAAREVIAAIIRDQDAITRAATAMLKLHRASNGLAGGDLSQMRPEHRAEWLDDARVALLAIAPDLATGTPAGEEAAP